MARALEEHEGVRFYDIPCTEFSGCSDGSGCMIKKCEMYDQIQSTDACACVLLSNIVKSCLCTMHVHHYGDANCEMLTWSRLN